MSTHYWVASWVLSSKLQVVARWITWAPPWAPSSKQFSNTGRCTQHDLSIRRSVSTYIILASERACSRLNRFLACTSTIEGNSKHSKKGQNFAFVSNFIFLENETFDFGCLDLPHLSKMKIVLVCLLRSWKFWYYLNKKIQNVHLLKFLTWVKVWKTERESNSKAVVERE